MTYIAILLTALLTQTACATTKYPISDHFDGERFFQPGVQVTKSFWEVLKWQFTSKPKKWPKWREDVSVPSKFRARTEKGELSTTYINHATHLIQIDGLNLITDPIYSERASPLRWAGPKRVHAPAVKFEDLPHIDVVLISHNHYDHMDANTILQLRERFDPLFVVPLGNSTLIQDMGANRVQELDWWQDLTVEGVKISLTPAQHWSARGVLDRNRALWGSFAIKGEKQNIYFGGDTGYGPHFKKIGDELGPFDLSLIPIGAYEPRWFMKNQHVNPEEAVRAHRDLRSCLSLGTHFGTFRLTDEAIDDPARELVEALKLQKVSEKEFLVPRPGETLDMKP